MRAVGPYAEFKGHGARERHPALREVVRDRREADHDVVVDYLCGGRTLMAFMGLRRDVLSEAPPDVMENANTYGLVTDGEWLWDGDFWYYVDSYNVGLPEDFLEHIRSNDYAVPTVTVGQVLSVLDDSASMAMFPSETDARWCVEQFVSRHQPPEGGCHS